MRWVSEHFDFAGCSWLDYGCGYGTDLELFNPKFEAQNKGKPDQCSIGYDPNCKNAEFVVNDLKWLYGTKFEIVTCNYVLNVLMPHERITALKQAWDFVAPGGKLFVATRTTKEIEKLAKKGNWVRYEDGYITSKKTFQRGFDVSDLETLVFERLYSNGVSSVWSNKHVGYTGLIIRKSSF